MMMVVNPSDLRFTQDSVAYHFKAPHEHFRIREALKLIKTGQMSPDDFPRVRVISHEGCLWSMDNRRLWVFRKAKCSQITVTMMTKMHYRLEEVLSLRSRFMKLSKANFFPRVRGSQNVLPTLAVAQQGPHPRVGVAEVMSRHGFLERARGSENVLPMPTVACPNVRRQLVCAVSGFERPSSRPGLLILLRSSFTTGLQTESSNPDSSTPFSSSSSRPSGGRYDNTRPQPAVEPSAHTRRYFGTQDWWSDLEQQTSERTPFSASTHDDERPTESWFGWVRNLIFGLFGCGEQRS